MTITSRTRTVLAYLAVPLALAAAIAVAVDRDWPREKLEAFTLELASRIATRPSMGLKLAKQSVNQAQDAQGFWTALQAAMSLQQLGHSNNQQVHGMLVDPRGAEVIRREAKG